jgi:hypothetical protein
MSEQDKPDAAAQAGGSDSTQLLANIEFETPGTPGGGHLGFGMLPGKKRYALYLREGQNITPLAYFNGWIEAGIFKRAMFGG